MDTSQICPLIAFHIVSEKPFSEQTGRGAGREGSRQIGEQTRRGTWGGKHAGRGV